MKHWLRALVRADFVAAVALTVLVPLAFLVQAVRRNDQQRLRELLRYWRGSSLLMVTVYLLIGERRAAFVSGVAARMVIAWTLTTNDERRTTNDTFSSSFVVRRSSFLRYAAWRRTTAIYCVLGALLNAPMLRCAVRGELSPLCRAYVEPAQEFAALLHPGADRETLGRVGAVGLAAFVAGAAIAQVVERRGTR